ncbi:MAG: DUF4440 domain-containing protein [Ilumatobacteraceae bacterium]
MAERDLRMVRASERRLQDPSVRASAAQLEELLDDEFVEIGSSGRVWKRLEITDELTSSPGLEGVTTSELTARHAVADVIVVTYTTTEPSGTTQRSSWWRATGSGWRCFFHQGTRVSGTQRNRDADARHLRSESEPNIDRAT